MKRNRRVITVGSAAALSVLTATASAQDLDATADTLPTGELSDLETLEEQSIDLFATASPYVRYRRRERRELENAPNPCVPYYGKGGKIAGTVLGPILLAAGASLLAVGIDNMDSFTGRPQGKAQIAVGSVSIAGGIAALLSAPYGLKKRNRQRRAQRLAGCPAY